MSHEHAMLLYARLAAVSAKRRQTQGQTRFLALAGIAATRAGWPEVAARSHQLIQAIAPRHLVNRYGSFADALRDDDFQPFLRQIERFCPVERAEHLLSELGQEASEILTGESAGKTALAILNGRGRSL